MQLTFYGVRGSYPTSRKDQLWYGGNTTCLHFHNDAGQDLILDAGSGMRNLGRKFMESKYGSGEGFAPIIIGHTHWDHIMGLPFFHPMYVEGNRFAFYSAGQAGLGIEDILAGEYQDLHFPISLKVIPSSLEFNDFVAGDNFDCNGFRVHTIQLNHPGMTIGYRVESDGGSVVVFTDTARISEVRLGDGMGGLDPDPAYSVKYRDAITEFCRDCDILVHDSHFLEHEMVGKYHWGHTTVEDCVDLCRRSNASNLFLFHHAPEHSDNQVEAKAGLARDLLRRDAQAVFAATEGWTAKIGEKLSFRPEVTS